VVPASNCSESHLWVQQCTSVTGIENFGRMYGVLCPAKTCSYYRLITVRVYGVLGSMLN